MSQSDWGKLSAEQQDDVNAWREHVCQILIAETETFYQQHPELRFNWSFTVDPLIRADNPIILKEL